MWKLTVWTYGFYDTPNHPPAEKELEQLAFIHRELMSGEMTEMRLVDRPDPPGKGAGRRDLFVFVVREDGEPRIRGRGVVGGRCRFGSTRPWMRAVYGETRGDRHWLPFSRFEVFEPRPLGFWGLRKSDLPKPGGQAFVKRLEETAHLEPSLWRWTEETP